MIDYKLFNSCSRRNKVSPPLPRSARFILTKSERN
jgi:hypothetical protein